MEACYTDNVFNLTASFRAGPYVFTFHPIYQTIFFFAYVLLGLGVWFVYSEFFRIAAHQAVRADGLQGAAQGKEIPHAVVDDADHHSAPLVEGISL